MNDPHDTTTGDLGSGQLQLSLALQAVLRETAGTDEATAKPLTLGLVINATGERSLAVLMAFLCLPFLTPIPLPVISIPFGIALLILGAQLAIRKHRPWLPKRMLAMRLPPRLGPALIRFLSKIFRPLEKIVKPRLLFMQNRVAVVIVGIALMLDGLALAALPPIPGSNAIPAWMAMIKILGITEGDGISLLAGTILSLAMVATFVILIMTGAAKLSA